MHVHRRLVRGNILSGDGGQRAASRGADRAVLIPLGHRRHTVHQVAQVVGEVGVVLLLEPFPREVAVAAVRNFFRQVEPQRIGTKARRRIQRIDDVPHRLAHALALEIHPAVAEHLLGQRDAGAHQHGRPDHTVEARDVLADHVQAGGPPFLEPLFVPAVADGRRIVNQRVEPDIDHARGIEGYRNAPRLPGATHRDVFQPAFNQPQDLVAANVGLDEARVLGEVLQQRLLVLREPEEPVLLLDPLRLGVVDRAIAVDQVLLLLEGLAADAVEALVGPFVDVAVVEALLRHLLDGRLVALGVRSADEVVERNIKALPHLAEDHLHLVAVGKRILALLGRLAEHILRMLVVAHQEMGLEPRQAAVARNDVGRNFFVGRAQVRPAIHEIDCRR